MVITVANLTTLHNMYWTIWPLRWPASFIRIIIGLVPVNMMDALSFWKVAKQINHCYLEVIVDKIWNDEFWLWFVLTIDDVHLELAVVPFEQVAKLNRVLHWLGQVFQKETETKKIESTICVEKIIKMLHFARLCPQESIKYPLMKLMHY
jgi:hypothetical protein